MLDTNRIFKNDLLFVSVTKTISQTRGKGVPMKNNQRLTKFRCRGFRRPIIDVAIFYSYTIYQKKNTGHSGTVFYIVS